MLLKIKDHKKRTGNKPKTGSNFFRRSWSFLPCPLDGGLSILRSTPRATPPGLTEGPH